MALPHSAGQTSSVTAVPLQADTRADNADVGLRSGAIGLGSVLMHGVTHIAPAVGLVLSIQFITANAGVAAPLAFGTAFLIVLTLGVSLTQLAKHLPSAGGYYTYVSRTVHPRAGFLTAWLYFLYDPTGAAINIAFMGYFFNSTLKAEYGIAFPWWAFFLIAAALVTVLTIDEHRIVERWWNDVLTDPAMTPDRAVLCHGDLWYENVLVDARRSMVSGVIDFEDANVGDPAQDFATLRHLDDRFVIAAIDAYRIAGGVLAPAFVHRVQRYGEMRELGGLYFALLHDDEEEFADSVRKLRAGAILNPNAHPPLQLSRV